VVIVPRVAREGRGKMGRVVLMGMKDALSGGAVSGSLMSAGGVTTFEGSCWGSS